MRRILFLLAFFLGANEEQTIKTIHNHLIIHDYTSAAQVSREAMQAYPFSKVALAAVIKSYARGGQEKEMMTAYKQFKTLSPTDKEDRAVLEEMCWGVIQKGEKSHALLVKAISLLAACYGNDHRGVEIVHKHLADSNANIRALAAEVSMKLGDGLLKKEIVKRFFEEREWEVRLRLIEAAGALKIGELKPQLFEVLSLEASPLEEKEAAVEALVVMLEDCPREEIIKLSQSKRFFLRLLAAELIASLESLRDVDVLINLTQDERGEVRARAWNALGFLRVAGIEERAAQALEDTNLDAAMQAAYALLLSGSDIAHRKIRKWFSEEPQEVRLKLASLLKASGKYGMELAKERLKDESDFFTRMNLALALMDLDTLYQGLVANKERWAMEHQGPWTYLAKSQENHRPSIPNYPEALDKETRLEIINILAIKGHPRALDAMKAFLKEKAWGIPVVASAFLLTEGDESAVELVRELMQDPDPGLRLQAALVLSMWDKEEKVSSVLIEHYKSLNRDRKEVILEALGRIGDSQARNFLIEEIGSSYPTLRIIAASSLLKCLYE